MRADPAIAEPGRPEPRRRERAEWVRAVVVALPGLALAAIGSAHPLVLTPATAHHWTSLHLLLVPFFPLLAVALWMLLRHRSGPIAGLARLAGYGYAACYSALDVLAGIGAGTVVEHDRRGSQNMLDLLATGDRFGFIGGVLFIAASVLTTVCLGLRHGIRVLPGGALLVVSAWLFLTHHIYPPTGVLAQVGIAAGCAGLALAGRPAAADRPA